MPRHNTIDYIEFPAADLAATKAFYTQVFGWTFTDYGPDYTSFQDGKLAGGFYHLPAPNPAPNPPAAPSAPSSRRPAPLVVIFVDDLPTAESNVVAAGGVISKPTFSFPGGSRFHFTDPSGNELSAWHEG
jgi:uncharacterized protein